MKPITIIIIVLVIFVGGILIWGVGSNWGKGYTTTKTTTGTPATETPALLGETLIETTVEMQNFSFKPNILEIPVGAKVIWINRDGVNHTVTSDTGVFSSAEFGQNATYEFVFTAPGTYIYHCIPHPNMTGTITVK